MLHTDETCLKLNVSKATLSRALRIFNAVIEVWEQEGGSVTASSFGLKKNSVQVKLSEQVNRLVDESGKNAYWKRYKYEKTGNLVLEIDSLGGAGLRKTWADGKVQRLEEKLGNFIKTLHQWMNSLEEHPLDEECRARQRQVAEHFVDFFGVLAERGVHRELHAFGECIATFVAFLHQMVNRFANVQEGSLDVAHVSSRQFDDFNGVP